MSRVKRGKSHLKHRKNILKQTKGYRWGRKSKITLAKTAILKAGVNAYRDRRNKKRAARALWQIKINAACRLCGTTYSKLMGKLKKSQVILDRKVLAEIAKKYPEVFKAIVG
ncbi:MAG: 50S ribosomal protein L20 [Candidatus Magasanikbacteria bacterium GW2011_GWC2_40_17]|uniref:50S ribosomal protein L20 n=1 Tax=Candidatus Magasanikbacteria bacterium GW2011_GWA2_42_32 TaxID=1619039 RepID=A0A0G1CDT9_9BACT|nr:MAG: 50S ribosomal protein L20 [Candidatus Magasanikbacteria bacterium GW2011_GWC2_40_17]KKS56866.1 MAG: 50S ribosomal protein L20 [Candidatus Magasanikbacteria bacterium GW2011_GWA2_42_32]OGH85650.1 MAG: 50S ribosomal protein L20 [Candidatus Magasanikbacteria bacterium RIFOXYB2_FULL_38_10]